MNLLTSEQAALNLRRIKQRKSGREKEKKHIFYSTFSPESLMQVCPKLIHVDIIHRYY